MPTRMAPGAAFTPYPALSNSFWTRSPACSFACSFASLLTGLLAGLIAVSAAGVHAQTGSMSPVGEWRTFGDGGTVPRGVVRISERDGVFTGVIARSLVPGEDPDKRCSKCTDARKDQLLRGMAIVTGMRFIDGDYSGGEILDPDTGGVYRSSMRLSEDGRRLTVRGYIGIPLFGRSQEWVRAD